MEKRGAVNFYTYYNAIPVNGAKKQKPSGLPEWFAVINLASGVTPFMHVLGDFSKPEACGHYASHMYRFPAVYTRTLFERKPKGSIPDLIVTHAHYRPYKAEFLTLDNETQKHVLQGGLLFGVLGKCQSVNNPEEAKKNEISLLEWIRDYYS